MSRNLKIIIAIGSVLFMLIGSFFTYYYIEYQNLNNAINEVVYWSEESEFNIEDIQSLATNQDGTFKIMQITDLHLINGLLPDDKKTLQLVEKLLVQETPDLVVATGDIFRGIANYFGVKALANLFERYHSYWAYVLGNHDGEAGLTNAGIVNLLSKYPHCLVQAGPENIAGNSNYFINLKNNNQTVFTLSFLDSNGSNKDKSDVLFIQDNQLDWYADTLSKIKAVGGEGLSSMLFTHIPVQEYNDLYLSGEYEGHVLDSGVVNEEENSNLFETMLQVGGVKAMFAGHYHLNTIRGEYNGIYLVNGLLTGHQSYFGDRHPEYDRGATIIELNTNDASFVLRNILASEL